MAQPLEFDVPPYNQRETLRARIALAPEDHADAILAAYDVLQQLHERGILDFVRSGLATSEELLATLAEVADGPEVNRIVRNLLVLQGVLGRIEPQQFQGILQAIPDGLAMAGTRRDEPVSLWRVLRRALSRDSLRGLAAAIDVLSSVGRQLHALDTSAQASRR